MKNLIAVLVSVTLFACIGSEGRRQETVYRKAPPADLLVEFGEGGGMTGLWNGFTLLADGSVERWSGRVAGENRQAAGRLPSTAVQSLWSEIARLDLLGSSASSTRGNMTRMLTIRAQGTYREFTWAVSPAGPPNLDRMYVFCTRLIQNELGQ